MQKIRDRLVPRSPWEFIREYFVFPRSASWRLKLGGTNKFINLGREALAASKKPHFTINSVVGAAKAAPIIKRLIQMTYFYVGFYAVFYRTWGEISSAQILSSVEEPHLLALQQFLAADLQPVYFAMLEINL